MGSLLITVLNLSLTGTYVIIAILLARVLLKKSPKIISYGLWVVAGVRLVLPFSINSIWSLVPFRAQPIVTDAITAAIADVASIGEGASTVSIMITIGGFVWIIGAIVMFGYGVVSYVILKRKLRGSVRKQGNVFEGIHVRSPYVLGFVSPQIYLPLGLSEDERKYVVLHEQIHIRRLDHFVKFIAYSILSLHWFNPLVWLAFGLMCSDMEMSCDERVLKEMGIEETKEDYSMTLVTLAIEKRFVTGSPLAFGESGVKARVKNVLTFKRYSKLKRVVEVILVVVLSVGLMMNTARTSAAQDLQEESIWPIYPTFSCCTGEMW